MKKYIKDYVKILAANGLLMSCNASEEQKNKEVEYISYSSMDAKGGTLFICKGAAFKREYLVDAAEKGALCYVAERDFNMDIPAIIVSDIRKANRNGRRKPPRITLSLLFRKTATTTNPINKNPLI